MDRRRFLLHTAQSAAAFGVLRHLSACADGHGGGATDTASVGAIGGFAGVRDAYFVRTLSLNPVTSTYLGGDSYSPVLQDVNGRLRDYRAEAIAEEVKFLRDTQRQLGTLDATKLSATDKIDQSLMNAQIAFQLRQLEERKYYQRAVDSYVAEPFRGVDWQLQQMRDAGGGLLGTEDEWRHVIARLDAVPGYLETAKANLLAGRSAGNMPDHRMVQRDGISGSGANATYFRTTLAGQAKQYLGARPFASSVLGDVSRAGGKAADAYTAFATWLGTTFPATDATDRFAAGEEDYAWRLKNNLRENRTTAELYDYGAQQAAMYEDRIYGVAAEVARGAGLALPFDVPATRGESVRKVMDYLGKDAPKNDDELFAWYRDAGARAVTYGREHDLFDIPAEYRLDVIPTPPVLRSTIDAAYYMAPPFKKSGVGRFYLTPTENDAAALAQNNRASIADTAIHEGFPGHDWHFKYMTQHANEISNVRWLTPGGVEDSSSMWADSPPTEGWGLYSEELMAEAAPGRPYGFYTPAEYLYELQGQLLRAVRVRVDVGMHTGRMTYDQAVDYFTEHVNFYPNARAAAASDPTARAIMQTAERAIYRYSKWPTQAITYNLGKNAIIQLRESYKQKRGAAYTAKAFHEQFMRQGPIAVGYYRDALLA